MTEEKNITEDKDAIIKGLEKENKKLKESIQKKTSKINSLSSTVSQQRKKLKGSKKDPAMGDDVPVITTMRKKTRFFNFKK